MSKKRTKSGPSTKLWARAEGGPRTAYELEKSYRQRHQVKQFQTAAPLALHQRIERAMRIAGVKTKPDFLRLAVLLIETSTEAQLNALCQRLAQANSAPAEALHKRPAKKSGTGED